MKHKVAVFLALLGMTLTVAGCLMVTNPATQKEEFVLFNDIQEVQIGQQVVSEVEKEYKVSQDPRLNSWVEEIGQRLVAVSERKNLRFQFKVLDRDEINAFALPGGFIYVHKGLLKAVDDDAELAGVLAHEIGHVTARHGIRKLQTHIGYNLLMDILFKDNAKAQELMNVGFTLVVLGYGRENEFQADKLSVIYALRAGYNPHGIAQFLQKIKQMQKREPSIVETLLSTHPPTSERIKRVNEEIARLRPPQKG